MPGVVAVKTVPPMQDSSAVAMKALVPLRMTAQHRHMTETDTGTLTEYNAIRDRLELLGRVAAEACNDAARLDREDADYLGIELKLAISERIWNRVLADVMKLDR
ncbi:hypothetical protein D2E44_19095 [Mycobacteroides abscessus]|nr:hypothetical protein D2E44_19095 [Mycobacteroides abscessus]